MEGKDEEEKFVRIIVCLFYSRISIVQNWVGAALAGLIFVMLTYFALSIVSHLAQRQQKRRDDERLDVSPPIEVGSLITASPPSSK